MNIEGIEEWALKGIGGNVFRLSLYRALTGRTPAEPAMSEEELAQAIDELEISPEALQHALDDATSDMWEAYRCYRRTAIKRLAVEIGDDDTLAKSVMNSAGPEDRLFAAQMDAERRARRTVRQLFANLLPGSREGPG